MCSEYTGFNGLTGPFFWTAMAVWHIRMAVFHHMAVRAAYEDCMGAVPADGQNVRRARKGGSNR